MKIYVASGWRNIYQPAVVDLCRKAGHETYDFRNPGPGDNGFGWSEIDPSWKAWDFDRYRKLLQHPRAEQGFALDMGALKACDACLLVYPCGKSAHLELGWAAGAGKRTAVLHPKGIEHPIGKEAFDMFKGHNLNADPLAFCQACDSFTGCKVPGKLERDFEPELMVKMADVLLTGQDELVTWLVGLR